MNKIVSVIVALSLTLTLAVPSLAATVPKKSVTPVTVPVFMLHDVVKGKTVGNRIGTDDFRAILKGLKAKGYDTILLSDLKDYLSGNASIKLPKKPMILTFDDGYKSNLDLAYPILRDFKYEAVFFPIGWSIGLSTFPDGSPITPHISLADLKKISDTKVIEIGNHTFDLHSPKGKSYFEGVDCNLGVKQLDGESSADYFIRLSNDLAKAEDVFKVSGITTNKFIAYPYGATSQSTDYVIKNSGFSGSLLVTPGLKKFSKPSDLFNIPRINMLDVKSFNLAVKTYKL